MILAEGNRALVSGGKLIELGGKPRIANRALLRRSGECAFTLSGYSLSTAFRVALDDVYCTCTVQLDHQLQYLRNNVLQS
jgi:hypothetical protein